MSIELKIKSKHLSEEAKIIRFEERKLKKTIDYKKSKGVNEIPEKELRLSLKSHRKWDVRNENRATFLARAFLSGKKYSTVERKVHFEYKLYNIILPRVLTMVNKYGITKITLTDLREWIKT